MGDAAIPVAVAATLDGASLWGLELETRYRVLAATLEPPADQHPRGAVDDRRLQVLFHPVHTILASLRRRADGQVEAFTVDQLVDVAQALGGSPVRVRFDDPEPAPGEWGPAWSLEGRARTDDGRAHSVTLQLEDAADRILRVYATFDGYEVRDPSGQAVDLGERSAG